VEGRERETGGKGKGMEKGGRMGRGMKERGGARPPNCLAQNRPCGRVAFR